MRSALRCAALPDIGHTFAVAVAVAVAAAAPLSHSLTLSLFGADDSGNPSEKSCISICWRRCRCWRRCFAFFTGIRMEIIVFNSALNVFQLALKAKLVCVYLHTYTHVCVCVCMCVNRAPHNKLDTTAEVQV